jgi:acetyltransferase-like isoleucine patch superfamily enzyme
MIRHAWNTPWKVRNELWRWMIYPRVRLLFAMSGIPWDRSWRFHGVPIIQKHHRSRMSFGPGLGLRSSPRSNPLAPNHPVILTTWIEGACLQVGETFRMTGGCLCAAQKIIIGNYVVVGANTTIVDTDFHATDSIQRWVKPSDGGMGEVAIEDNVFIGMNCLILKGVRIGKGSVIGAGSVVTEDVPPNVIVAGNPARLVRRLDNNSKTGRKRGM